MTIFLTDNLGNRLTSDEPSFVGFNLVDTSDGLLQPGLFTDTETFFAPIFTVSGGGAAPRFSYSVFNM